MDSYGRYRSRDRSPSTRRRIRTGPRSRAPRGREMRHAIPFSRSRKLCLFVAVGAIIGWDMTGQWFWLGLAVAAGLGSVTIYFRVRERLRVDVARHVRSRGRHQEAHELGARWRGADLLPQERSRHVDRQRLPYQENWRPVDQAAARAAGQLSDTRRLMLAAKYLQEYLEAIDAKSQPVAELSQLTDRESKYFRAARTGGRTRPARFAPPSSLPPESSAKSDTTVN